MNNLHSLIAQLQFSSLLRAVLLIIAGYFVSKLISSSAATALKKRISAHQAMLLRRILFYIVFILFFFSAIQELGFSINALLGATGILTVAIGIAAQTSMSNLISGIFIIGEKPFEIGNTIKVNNISGEVLSIDFLSVKIRTNDNTMIRIPNETLIKSAITNMSYFSTRRIDILFLVNYAEAVDTVKALLLATAKAHPDCLDTPAPTVTVDSLSANGIQILLTAWAQRTQYSKTKNELLESVCTAIRQNNIDIPNSSSSLYTGSIKDPLHIKIIQTEPST